MLTVPDLFKHKMPNGTVSVVVVAIILLLIVLWLVPTTSGPPDVEVKAAMRLEENLKARLLIGDKNAINELRNAIITNRFYNRFVQLAHEHFPELEENSQRDQVVEYLSDTRLILVFDNTKRVFLKNRK